MRLKVLVVDDHKMVRAGLRALLQDDGRIEVTGEAERLAEVLEACRAANPDVVLMDVRLPDGKGYEICGAIKAEHPETKILMLTSYGDDELVLEAIGAGADGYLLKEIDGQDLAQAIVAVTRSGAVFDRTITRTVLSRMRSDAAKKRSPLDELSVQEKRVLEQVAEGKTNKEIATELGLEEKTVRNYFSSVLGKLGVSRRTEAAALYFRETQPRPKY